MSNELSQRYEYYLTCLLLIGLLSLPVAGQTRKAAPKHLSPKRAVTIKTKQGQVINGNFLGATMEVVKVEEAAGPRLINIEDVLSINFGEAKQMEKAREAVKALQSLVSATSVGLNYHEYSRRLVDVKIVVDDALKQINNDKLQAAISDSLRFFEDALLYWRNEVQHGMKNLILSEKLIRGLEIKYGPEVRSAVSPIDKSENQQVETRGLVSAVLTAAERKTQLAERLLAE